MPAYFNEYEPYAAAWLNNLVAAGHIAQGTVDARSIKEVGADELAGVVQAHFFAGIGVWSYALRLAGWPDDRPVWTGSCPCQPFSSAGKREGFVDPRHLWPDWFKLIEQRRPPVVFGEQVASSDGYHWLDLVSSDMEAAGYAFGAAVLPAAGVGAPHLRHRIFFVAYDNRAGLSPEREVRAGHRGEGLDGYDTDGRGAAGGLAVAPGVGLDGRGAGEARDGRDEARLEPQRLCDAGRLVNAISAGPQGRIGSGDLELHRGAGAVRPTPPTGVSGFWKDAEWIPCRDGKYRPVEPGTFPLAHGAPSRVGRLRAYGNAIVPQVAATFIRAAMDSIPGMEAA